MKVIVTDCHLVDMLVQKVLETLQKLQALKMPHCWFTGNNPYHL